MKKINLIIAMMIIAVCAFAQTPQAFKYQAVARDNAGNILADQNISLRISILKGSPSGTTVYSEIHDTVTNPYGFVNLEIGNGTLVSGIFENIGWDLSSLFLQIEMDENGGSNYQIIGTSQVLSVPYAMHSKTASTARGLILTDKYGQEYTVSLDPNGNIVSRMMLECGDTIYDTRDGQKYTTVLIGNQCWMAENLNIGTRIDGGDDQSNNDTIEKYCYNNLETNCDTYGGLYQWNEMIQYATTEGVQGICPHDWQLPTDEEWKQLEGTVDSQYPVGDPIWNNYNYRGHDAGLNLKSASGWSGTGNGTDLYGFTALPGGCRNMSGGFGSLGEIGYFMTSTEYSNITTEAVSRVLHYDNHDNVLRWHYDKYVGLSVRCLKTNLPPDVPSNPSPENGAVNQSVNIILNWTCTDPENDLLTYDLYFGFEADPPLLAQGISNPMFSVNLLNYGITYYWKIIAKDIIGLKTEGPVWSFTIVFTCGDSLFDTRDGQKYSTMQIGTQFWIARNLNIVTRIDAPNNQTNNGTIEKYCYNNLETNCDTYGGLYQWNEMMQFTSTPGAQGICPDGWHLPTDEEWKVLEGAVDSQFGYPDPVWDIFNEWRGYDAGLNLKALSGWNGSDLYGFKALPSGKWEEGCGGFFLINEVTDFWTSNQYSGISSWFRELYSFQNNIYRNYFHLKTNGNSARCLKD
ncbi:MAG: hypothetical protein K8R74_09130 [Bacteroidales bacterium]|nr:hypothetical protein [Bacteroidales bacterium]